METHSSANQSLSPYRFGFVFSFFNSTSWMVALGTPAVLLAESLGANTFEVGLLYSFVFLLLPVQVLATATLPRFGYKNQVLFAWSMRTLFLLIPLAIILSAPKSEDPAMVNWLLLAMFCFCFFRSIGTCAVQPWLFDLLPEKLQARYFSTDMAVINIGGVITLVFCSITFIWLPTFQAFSAQYTFAFIGAILSILGLTKMPAVAHPKSFGLLRILKEGPALLLARGSFRQYLVLSLVWVVSGSAVVPFSIYYLKAEASLTQTSIVLFTAIQAVGGIAGALFMKSRIDRFGIRRSFLVVIVLNLFIYISWVVLISYGMTYPDGSTSLLFLLPVTYFLLGAAGATYFSSHLKYLAFVTQKNERALKVSLQTAVVGLATGIASIGWGILFKKAGATPTMNLPTFLGYFLFIILIQLVLIPTIRKLKEPDPSVKPLTNSYGIMRPFRFIATLPVLHSRKQKLQEESSDKQKI
ncbi:MAG: MFS transporter [Verrucomicrobia bacterium]|nr:MFS transporter [Verrucomicrobiota bacterium]